MDIFEIVLGPDEKGCEEIINKIAEGKLSPEVVEIINKFARGNYGAATVLTKLSLSRNLKTKEEIEALVGWPLWSHTSKKAELIWDKFKNEIN